MAKCSERRSYTGRSRKAEVRNQRLVVGGTGEQMHFCIKLHRIDNDGRELPAFGKIAFMCPEESLPYVSEELSLVLENRADVTPDWDRDEAARERGET